MLSKRERGASGDACAAGGRALQPSSIGAGRRGRRRSILGCAMNEAETRAELIDPALRAAGWNVVEHSKLAREVRITHGRLLGAGIRREPTTADYVLIYRGKKLGVIEAKKRDAELTEGL